MSKEICTFVHKAALYTAYDTSVHTTESGQSTQQLTGYLAALVGEVLLPVVVSLCLLTAEGVERVECGRME